jgi:UDP-glucose 4-epimerase
MKVLIAGGNGFIGAWIVKRLSRRGINVRIFDVVENRSLVSAIAGDVAAWACEWRVGDIAKASAVQAALEGCDGVINLAGILTPACQADPVRGAEINLIGTLNVFEAAKALGLKSVIYTSSAGVYGPTQADTPFPTTHYGAFKLACEGSARAYWADDGIASIGFRPYIVYGPGRETGLTAGPSLACRAAARGRRFVIPYRGTAGLVYVDDVAAAYEQALLTKLDGAHALNIPGVVTSNDDVVAEILRVIPNADISIEGPELPFVADIGEGRLRQVLPDVPVTSLRAGIAETIAFYRATPGA